MNEIDALIVGTAFTEMYRKGWFDICAVDAACKIMGIVPNRAAHDRLRALHCVDFGRMPPELQRELPNLIRECLGGRDVAELAKLSLPPGIAVPNRLQ